MLSCGRGFDFSCWNADTLEIYLSRHLHVAYSRQGASPGEIELSSCFDDNSINSLNLRYKILVVGVGRCAI
jgi:hypothetical protein